MNEIATLISSPPRPGVYRWLAAAAPDEVCRAGSEAGWHCYVLDARTVRDKGSFLDACARAFGFPDWFGHNWDALEEALTDLADSAAGAPASIILYEGWAAFASAEPEQWRTALSILRATVERWRERSAPLYVLLRGDGPAEDVPEYPW